MEVKDTYRELSLGAIISLLIKSFCILLICSIIGLLLGLGFDYFHSNRESQLERYSFDLESYQYSVSEYESKIAYMNNVKRFILERIQQDPIQSMDLNNIFKTNVSFMLVGDAGQNPDGLAALVKSYWNSMNLQSVLDISLKDEFIRSFITLSSDSDMTSALVQNENQKSAITNNNGISAVSFNLVVLYDNEKTSELYASTLFSEIEVFLSDYGISIRNKNITTEKNAGEELVKKLEADRTELSDIDTQIIKAKNELKDLQKTEPTKYHFVKSSVLGFLAGGLISVVLIVVSLLNSNPVILSFDAEERLRVPFIGAIFESNGFFSRMARRIIGERCFESEIKAEEEIKNHLSCSAFVVDHGSRIIVMSSRNDKKTAKAATILCNLIQQSGFSSSFVSACHQNPESIKDIYNADAVIILEEQWKSKWIHIASITQIIEKSNKPLVGFVLC